MSTSRLEDHAPDKKPFEVILVTEGQKDEVVMWGSDMPCLMPDYEDAIKSAKAKSKRDGVSRQVVLQQTLLRWIS